MKEILEKLTKKHYIWIGLVLAIIIIIIAVLSGNGNGNAETYVVVSRDIVDEVRVSGRVEAGIVADLGFEVSGRVTSVHVFEGDNVTQGTTLVSLDLGTLPAQLAQAEANVSIKEAEAANAQTNLDDVITQQDTLVESARRALLSSGLVAEAQSDSVLVTPPTISGRYSGLEGQYKIRIVDQDAGVHHELSVFGIESVKPIEINDTGSTPVGELGLYVSFPGDIEDYDDTIWYINTPNVDGAFYTQNLNAYEQALTNRDVTIEAAQAAVIAQQSGSSIAEAELARARADVAQIEAEIDKRFLVAPFTGRVGTINVDPGESAGANSVVAQLISEGDLGVEIDLPEVDSVKVKEGDKASITLDAFGDEEIFNAAVLFVNPIETLLDNVAVYEARVGFETQDERVASGMTAEVTIVTDRKDNVIAVPARAIRRNNEGNQYVTLYGGESEDEVVINTGLRGADSFVEIISGLQEGDTVLIPE